MKNEPIPSKQGTNTGCGFLESIRRATFSILLLGLFVNETNLLYRILVKAALGLRQDESQNQLTPEEEAAEALGALVATTLVGKVFEGWERLQDRKGVPISILDSLPISTNTQNLKAILEQKLSTRLFWLIRNNMAFHYNPQHIHVDRLKNRLTNLDTHFLIHPDGATGFTLSRLSTLALLEAIVGDDPNPDRPEAFTNKISEILQTTGAYSDFVSHLLIDVLKVEFGTLRYEQIIIPDAPTIDDNSNPLKFFVHPPKDFSEQP